MTTTPTVAATSFNAVPPGCWQREGAQPFEASRRALVRLIDALLGRFEADPHFTHYLADGQAVALEDHLAVRPGDEERLRALVSAGRLAVGPWYVLPAPGLTSAESQVRNVQLGMGLARRFGRATAIGDRPEAGAHAARLPWLLPGFGFEAPADAPAPTRSGAATSTRADLKLRNAHAQTLLERWVEPFSAIAALHGRAYPEALLDHAWRLLLQCQAPSALSGCSVDAVHPQLLTRFAQVDALGGLLRHEAFAALAGEDADADAEAPRQEGLRLYNPHPWAHVAPVEAELTLDCEPDAEPIFSLLDEHEQPVPCEVRACERGVRRQDGANVPTARLRLRLAVELPALGYRTLRVERKAGASVQHPELYAGNNWIENRYFKVRAVDGRLEIFDKSLEETFVHDFEDAGDRGDTFDFCPVDGETPIRTSNWYWDHREITHAGNSLRMTLTANWRLPGHLFEDRGSRIGSAPLPIAVEVSLHAGVRRVEFETTVTNVSRDHRFRAAFKTPGAIAQTHADTAFGWETRPGRAGECDWAETAAMASQVLVDRPLGQAGLAAVGLHEYEAVGDTLYLTLLRAVGWLSRDDLSTRPGDAGPSQATPDAQMLGRWQYRYAWVSQNDDEAFGTAQRLGQAFVVPAAAHPLAAWQGHQTGSYLSVDQPAWQLSALKRSEAGEHLVLRVFNTGAEPREGTVSFGFPVRSVVLSRLDETAGEPVVLDGDRLSLSLRGLEIGTFLVEPA